MMQQKAELLDLHTKLRTAKNEQRAAFIDQIDALLSRYFGNLENEGEPGSETPCETIPLPVPSEHIEFIKSHEIAQMLNNINVFYVPEIYNIKPARQRHQIGIKATMFQFDEPLSHAAVQREKNRLLQAIQVENEQYEEESEIDVDNVESVISGQMTRILTQNSQENVQLQQSLKKIGLSFDGSPAAVCGLKCFVYGNYKKALKSIQGILGQYALGELEDEILSRKTEVFGISGRSGDLLRVLQFLDIIWRRN